MLTPQDLQLIANLLDEKLDTRLSPIYQELQKHSEILARHEKTLKEHSKYLRKLDKTQSVILDVLDREQMRQRKRLDRVEEYLNLS